MCCSLSSFLYSFFCSSHLTKLRVHSEWQSSNISSFPAVPHMFSQSKRTINTRLSKTNRQDELRPVGKFCWNGSLLRVCIILYSFQKLAPLKVQYVFIYLLLLMGDLDNVRPSPLYLQSWMYMYLCTLHLSSAPLLPWLLRPFKPIINKNSLKAFQSYIW